MSQVQYGRKYKITIGDASDKGWDVSQLRCVFRIEHIYEQTPNNSLIEIYNLNPSTEASIIKEGKRVVVEAGYDGYIETGKTANGQVVMSPANYGQIYDGTIIQIIRTKDNNLDYKLTLVCNDNDQYINQALVMSSLAPKSKPRQVVEALATKSTVKIDIGNISEGLSDVEYPRGQVLFGQPKQFLRRIAQDNNAAWSVNDGKLYMNKATDVPNGSVLELTPETGLIGWPQATQEGVEFKCLLNSKIKIGRDNFVRLNLDQIRLQILSRGMIPTMLDQNGEYMVYKVTHTGDTRGNDWYSSVTGIARAGKGALPTLLQMGATNPFGGG